MYSIDEETPVMQLSKYFGPAKVLSFDKNYKTAVIEIQTEEGEFKTLGKSAITNSSILVKDDIVLAAGDDTNNLYIIGILSHSNINNAVVYKLVSNNGAYSIVNQNDNEEKIQVFDKNSDLIFEYDPYAGKSRVNIKSGDLEFITHDGNINFISGKGINFKSKHSIIIESFTNIQASVMNTINKVVSSLTFNQQKIKMSSPELNITVQRTDLKTVEMKYIGDKFSAVVKYGRLTAGKLETLSNDIICKAKNVYNTIDELVQLKAGRIRTLVKSTLHIKAKNSYLKSEQDFKINGEKIHLG